MKERFKAILSVYLVLNNEKGELLLSLRKNTGYCDGYYGLVSGHVEKNETILDGIIRESGEEAGIILDKKDLVLSCVMHRRSLERDCMDFFFQAKNWRGIIKNVEPHKCDELKFFHPTNLPNNLIDYINFGLKCIKSKNFYVEYGW